MSSLNIATSFKLSCCVCGTANHSVIRSRDKLQGLKYCQRCSLTYLEVFQDVSHNFINDAQEKSVEYWSVPSMHQKYAEVFTHYFQKRFERIQKYSLISGMTLDVGSGYGFWLHFLQQKQHTVLGIDVSAEAINYSNQEFGEYAKLCDFQKFSTQQNFAVITMCDVLEHLQNPEVALQKCYSLLNADGLLYIQVPNVLGLRIPYGHNLGLPHHLWQFNPKCLWKLIEQNGFEPLEYWTGVQGVIGEYEKGGPSSWTRLKWNFAEKAKVGNRLQIIARKKNAAY